MRSVDKPILPSTILRHAKGSTKHGRRFRDVTKGWWPLFLGLMMVQVSAFICCGVSTKSRLRASKRSSSMYSSRTLFTCVSTAKILRSVARTMRFRQTMRQTTTEGTGLVPPALATSSGLSSTSLMSRSKLNTPAVGTSHTLRLPRFMPSIENRTSSRVTFCMKLLNGRPGTRSDVRASSSRSRARCTGCDRSRLYLPDGSSSNSSVLGTSAAQPLLSSINILRSSGVPGWAKSRSRDLLSTKPMWFLDKLIRAI
mmetsp:Transcript_158563/g.508693  ORF Transcript_158563/g.508693 Transcript_158563/m.508693 type:complete len:255 (-) Transcript_158563:891-1655(-)